MTTTEFAQETENKALRARNTYLANACEELMQKDRINRELIDSLRSANHKLQEKIDCIESHQ